MSKDSRLGMLPVTASGKRCYELCTTRPDLNVQQITEMVQVDFPRHTEAATRMLLHRYGLSVTKREYTKPSKYKGKPKVEAKPVPKPGHQHTPIQSYHGRSRYLPAYYEL